MVAKAYAVHHLEGRTRFRVPQRRGDAAFFKEIADRLAQCAGIKGVETNPLTSSILVHHDGDIEGLIFQALGCGLTELVELELGSPPVARRLRADVVVADRRIRRYTHGELDLGTLAAFGLVIIGGVQLLRGQPTLAVSMMWYASELMRRWIDPRAPRAASAP
jgi:hypothetical protein